VLEEGKPFSQSFIWKLQRAFFEQQGNQAWSEGIIPHYITSNPYMANAYAALVHGWLRDWLSGGRPAPSADFAEGIVVRAAMREMGIRVLAGVRVHGKRHVADVREALGHALRLVAQLPAFLDEQQSRLRVGKLRPVKAGVNLLAARSEAHWLAAHGVTRHRSAYLTTTTPDMSTPPLSP